MQVDGLAADVVEEPARCRDEDLDAAPECLDLGVDRDAAVDDARAERQVLAVRLGARGDLHRELARRREDERPNRVSRRRKAAVRLRLQPLQDREHERGGLAGSGLGGREEVAALEHERDRLLLDGRRGGVALIGDGPCEFGRQAELRKWHVVPPRCPPRPGAPRRLGGRGTSLGAAGSARDSFRAFHAAYPRSCMGGGRSIARATGSASARRSRARIRTDGQSPNRRPAVILDRR